jgi:hypothetical protein
VTEVNLEITGDVGRISAHALKLGIQHTVGLLDEYAHAMSEREHAHLRWNIKELQSNGSLRVGFWSSVIPGRRRTASSLFDNSPAVASTLVSGIDAISREAVTPPFISEVGMRRVESFVPAIERNEAKSFTLGSQGGKAIVTHKTGDNLVKLIEIKRQAIGSVEGRLVGINVAKDNPKLSIIHPLSKKSVSCIVDPNYMEMAKNALGMRVIVYGTLYKNLNGDTIRVSMRDIQILAPGYMRAKLAGVSRLPIPEFANTRDTEDYLIGTRGE